VTVEPRVEELLASIRQAIDKDMGGLDNPTSSTSGNSHGTLLRGALREMRVNFDSDVVSKQQADTEIAALRTRIGRNRVETAFATPKLPATPRAVPPLAAPPSRRGGVGEILTGKQLAPQLRQSILPEEPVEEPIWDEPEIFEDEQQAYSAQQPETYYEQQAYAPPPPALISPQTAYSAQSSFQNLADTILARATNDRGLEDMTRDMLRGMLKNWLDDNLPDLVERLVREEIERVARRGR
jgi:uncharacterized protein